MTSFSLIAILISYIALFVQFLYICLS